MTTPANPTIPRNAGNQLPAETYAAAECLTRGEFHRAAVLAERALEKAPSPQAYAILADAHNARGEHRKADFTYRKGMKAFGDHPVLSIHYARFLRRLPGRATEAVDMLNRVIAAAPHFAPARLCLVETLRGAVQRLDLAEAAAHEYIAQLPDDPDAHLALALTLLNAGALNRANAAADQSLALTRASRGNAARAWEIKANAFVGLGAADETAACYRSLLQIVPDAAIHSRLLMAMQYCEQVSEDHLALETANWVQAHAARITPRQSWNVRFDAEKPLTVGILSRDFRQCSTLYLARPLLEHLPEAWTLVFYANVEVADGVTEEFRDLCDQWRDIGALDDAAAAERIAADGIDVLIDLNGHGLGGRPGVLARKPAPVQVSWLDYVGSTGLDTMDGIIADAGHLPLADQRLYREPILHVTDNLYRYMAPADAPPVAALPALKNGFVTFGCFNSAYKLSPGSLAGWREILTALPSARLLLNAREYAHTDTRERIVAQFGADLADRIEMREGATEPRGMLAAYADVDIALDPAPYSGGLTTLEGLYMGVPAVTKQGKRFGSRHSAVHLTCVGLADWIAPDSQSYIALAVEKAGQLDALATLREGLRARLEKSPLMDGATLAADFSAILRRLWVKACERASRV